jgi:hypothetical protein
MDFKRRYLEIQDFLKPYQRIWQNEIMLQYPNAVADYPTDWISDLVRFQDKETVIRLEKRDVFPFVQDPSLREFYQRIDELTSLPSRPDYPAMPEDAFTWLHMIPKKQHEIRRLAPHLNHLYREFSLKKVVDIGGGIGLLAQTVNNQYGLPVVSVDMDPALQKTGIERHKKNAKDPHNLVQYQNLRVWPESEFVNLLEEEFMPVGLHTCGRLALDIIRTSSEKKVKALVNFGCCYHTLSAANDLQSISNFAKENDPLFLSLYALTLSCRAHRKMSEKDFALKQKVKFYRYAIHILLHDHYDIPNLLTLGNSHPKLYDEPFSTYVFEQLNRVHITPKHTAQELDAFFADPKLQRMIKEMLAAGLIRNAMGRVLELYLLLDRAIYLEEQGYKVDVQEFFDEELSPRNIGITAVRI